MITVNALGDACPLPVVKAKKALEGITGPETLEVLVDNEIAVQNVSKMAANNGFAVDSKTLKEGEYKVTITLSEGQKLKSQDSDDEYCDLPGQKKKVVVAIGSNTMGTGDDELGAILIKGFIYALTQQDKLPSTLLFYNGGVKLTTKGSASLEDLKGLEGAGVEILSCGTCLNHYGLSEDLMVGGVTNMYDIVEKLTTADVVVRP